MSGRSALDPHGFGPQYAGNASDKGMTQMNPNNGGQPPRRRSSVAIFAALLIGGLLLLVVRMLSVPTVSLGEVILPLLAGVGMAAAIAVIVMRDRRERNALPPSERDTQDRGMPR